MRDRFPVNPGSSHVAPSSTADNSVLANETFQAQADREAQKTEANKYRLACQGAEARVTAATASS